MRKDISEETKKRLIPIYEQVEEDFSKFPNIKTTEDFFIWREQVKNIVEDRVKGTDKQNDINYKKKLRNKIIEDEIKGNSSLELLNDWSKCYRMIDRAKGAIRTFNDHYGIDDKDHVIKASTILHKHLVSNGKAHTSDLFDILQIRELNLLVKQPIKRTINTPYEFERAIVKEDESEAWSAPLFVTLLRAYGVEGEDLLTVGRKVEALGKAYINNINNSNVSSKKYVYTKRG